MAGEQSYFTVSRRIPHHASHSGYDQLSFYAGHPVVVPNWVIRMRGLGPVQRYFRKRSGMEWYNGLYSELFTSLHMRKHNGAIYHVLFGENEYRYLPKWMPNRNHKMICTFHTPPDEFRRVMTQTAHLKTLDAAIVVASNQVTELEKILPKERLFVVPHGVDVEYFVPPRNKTESKTCICVGHHHRDFETLARVASILKQRDPQIRIHVINRVFHLYQSIEKQKLLKQMFAEAGNVELLVDVPDEELLRIYQTSDLMILPLFDTTANVAVLESISCGLPMVVSDVGGIRDYLNEKCAALAPKGDAAAMADQVMRLLQNRTELGLLSKASREQALQFDWRRIAMKIKEVCNNL